MAAESRVLQAKPNAVETDWEAVYTEQLPRVYSFFRYRVGDEALAEDLTAVTFEKAWRARGRYRREVAGLTTWLFSIARHVAVDHFRRAAPPLPLDAAHDQPGDNSPEEVVERQGDFQRLALLLAGLPPPERELVALKYGADLTNREIARLAHLSESNVGTRLHRTVTKLRRAWEENP